MDTVKEAPKDTICAPTDTVVVVVEDTVINSFAELYSVLQPYKKYLPNSNNDSSCWMYSISKAVIDGEERFSRENVPLTMDYVDTTIENGGWFDMHFAKQDDPNSNEFGVYFGGYYWCTTIYNQTMGFGDVFIHVGNKTYLWLNIPTEYSVWPEYGQKAESPKTIEIWVQYW